MIEALRVLKVYRKIAVSARRIILQVIQMNLASFPELLREQLRHMSWMQLIRTP